MIKPQTLKGFRDFLPEEATKRQRVMEIFRDVFTRFGFEPLETPALEYAETLTGKYGSDADKLLYLFKDNGGRDVGLRYDQTVPLSRIMAQYQDIPLPFKRYQMQPVWRAEKPQKGRFREFLQCDIDIVGAKSETADVEIITATIEALRSLNIPNPIVTINDRTLFEYYKVSKAEIIIIDKLNKIGKEAVIELLTKGGRKDATNLFSTFEKSAPTAKLKTIFTMLSSQGYKEGVDYEFSPFLARGLDYYTSTIFEVSIPSYGAGSVAGGGRYDDLIGLFSGNPLPAVGIAFGFDRIMEILAEKQLLSSQETGATVLVTVFDEASRIESGEIASTLRNANINTDLYLEPAKLEKQLKYADKKMIPYVIVQGPDEKTNGVVQLKDMKTRQSDMISIEDVIKKLL
ncbi:MAG: histidine--tRNA ligase [Candidatus Gottesmanbacteria bacterium]